MSEKEEVKEFVEEYLRERRLPLFNYIHVVEKEKVVEKVMEEFGEETGGWVDEVLDELEEEGKIKVWVRVADE